MTRDELVRVLSDLYGANAWPKPFHVIKGVEALLGGAELAEVARAVGTSPAVLRAAASAPDPLGTVLGLGLQEIDVPHRDKATRILGQLLLGRCAEIAFEDIYRAEMHSQELELKDLRESRTDTDYRLYNGQGRPVYRINIKFHSSRFRKAAELVGLEAEDCFALATYKIHSALQKQEEERLPYFFAVVGVSNLSGGAVGRQIPTPLVETVALVHQAPRAKSKRDIEDAVIEHLVAGRTPVFSDNLRLIEQADWYVISARRAERLLREMLFQRVFALRVRNFAQIFKGAELDMHFSLTQDLIPLRRFLATLRDEGAHKVTTLLERGEF